MAAGWPPPNQGRLNKIIRETPELREKYRDWRDMATKLRAEEGLTLDEIAARFSGLGVKISGAQVSRWLNKKPAAVQLSLL